MNAQLTERQSDLLEFIEEYQRGHGFPPTLREMAEYMNVSSTNGINDHLVALERKGLITRVHKNGPSKGSGKPRTVQSTRTLTHTCPFCGHQF